MAALNSQGSLLEGPLDRRILRHNTKALDNEVYKTVGKIVALSIIHGGSGPVFFAESVLNYLFGDGQRKIQIKDVPNVSIQDKLKKVSLYTMDRIQPTSNTHQKGAGGPIFRSHHTLQKVVSTTSNSETRPARVTQAQSVGFLIHFLYPHYENL